MNNTGLTEDQAKAFHAAFMKYFLGSFVASVIAHVMVGFASGTAWYRFPG